MINFAVCDDEPFYLDQITSALSSFQAEEGEFHIDKFSCGEDLLADYAPGAYDIIILDIEMGGMSGLQAAEQIRRLDSGVLLMFLTNHSEFAIEGYQVNAFRYMLKGQSDYLYLKQLASVIAAYRQSVQVFRIETKGRLTVCKLNQIYYFEVMDKTILLHKADEVLSFPGKMADIEKRVAGYDFAKIHKSFLVNLRYVSYVESGTVLMKNEASLPLGRKFKAEFTDRYIQYISSK